MFNHRGNWAPELRGRYRPGSEQYTKASDMFIVGLILWQLAEHDLSGVFEWCHRSPCSGAGTYTCGADHCNPIQLPPCLQPEVPDFLKDIINRCREADPSKRLDVQEALKLVAGIDGNPPEMDNWRLTAQEADMATIIIACDQCGDFTTTRLHYHCNGCRYGDFDLCHECYTKGVRCKDPLHPLVKRVWSGTGIVELSS